MPIIDDCILWNKLGSAAEVATSEIGLNGTVDGTISYNTAKFDNGSYSNDINNRVRFASLNSATIGSWRNFIAEFWIRTDYNIVAGIPSDSISHGFLSYYQDSNNRLRWVLDSSAGVDVSARIGAVWYLHRNIYTPSWNSATDVHFLVAVNSSGIGGGADKLRIYVDGGLIYNSANDYNTWSTTQDLYLLVQRTIGAVVTPFNGVMDNIKLYDSTAQLTAILANRENEGFPTGYPIANRFNFQRLNSD
jgi:hypothetical protein